LATESKLDKVWAYIVVYATSNGVVPTYEEIMVGCKFRSKSTVNYYMRQLVKEGTLNKRPKGFTIHGARLIIPSRVKRT
jgi:SOS-response transcriptional repressor LexA